MKKILFAVCLLIVLAGCSTFQKHDPLPVSGVVDVDRFMGKWYVLGVVPSIIDGHAYNIIKTYQRGDRGINIYYQFNSGSYDGKQKTYSTRAMVDNPGINTDWKVRIVTWPFDKDYKILHVESDYSAALVGQPNRKGLWIMSRTKTMDDPLYSDLILKLQALGYNVGKIRRVPQR